MKLLVPKTAAIVITTAAAMFAVPAMASAAPMHAAAKHASKVSVSASPRVAVAGTTVKLSATVSSANPKPTGSVTFWWGSHKLCSANLVNRSGHCNTSFRTAGSYAVRGVYSGDAKHAGTTGKVTVVSSKAATTTSISVSSLAPTAGTSVTFNAGVSSHSPLAATGKVLFTSGSTFLCNVVVSKGAASCTYAFNVAGSYTVTATYLGDGAHAASHGTSGTIKVQAAPKNSTTTTITGANPNPDDPGATATITVAVTSATGTPTGTVAVAATGADAGLAGDSCTATLSGGTGSCTVTPAADTFGDVTFVATYKGDATHSGSKSANYTLHVPAPTTTTVTFAKNTLTADVANPVGNNISPSAGGTGTVTFTFATGAAAGTPIPGCTDVPLVFTQTGTAGTLPIGTNAATCAYTPTAAGTVTATYSGDNENQTSMGTVDVTA
jgi:hypothetical protein